MQKVDTVYSSRIHTETSKFMVSQMQGFRNRTEDALKLTSNILTINGISQFLADISEKWKIVVMMQPARKLINPVFVKQQFTRILTAAVMPR